MQSKHIERYFPDLAALSLSEREEIFDLARHEAMVVGKQAGKWTVFSVALGLAFATSLLICIVVAHTFFNVSGVWFGPVCGVLLGPLFQGALRRRYANLLRPGIERRLNAKAT
ncbi:MAG: hypothetical protein AAF098_09555 [Pseudomonadota bacterium]